MNASTLPSAAAATRRGRSPAGATAVSRAAPLPRPLPRAVPLPRSASLFGRHADPHALPDALWHTELTARLDKRVATAVPEEDWRGLLGLLATLVAASLAAVTIVVLVA